MVPKSSKSCKKSRIRGARWKRKPHKDGGGRLARSVELVEVDNSHNSHELQVLSRGEPEQLYREMLESLVVQKHIKKKHVFYKKGVQESQLLALPEELLVMIVCNLALVDVTTLAETCKALKEFVNRNFVESVILPLSCKNLRKLHGRSVLSLISSFDVNLLKEGDYYSTIKEMNFKNLKRLKFNGTRYHRYYHRCSIHSRYCNTLSMSYIRCLTYYLGQAQNIRCLDVLVDNSTETENIINTIASELSCLKEITLRSMNADRDIEHPEYPGHLNVNYTVNTNTNNHSYASLNNMLATVLQNTSITIVRLRGSWSEWASDDGDRISPADMDYWFYHNCYYQNWEADNYYPLKISSKFLEVLDIQHFKFCVIKEMDCENLLELDIECMYSGMPGLADSEIYHPLPLAYLLEKSCPKLERYCNVNIKHLRDSGLSGDWVTRLHFVSLHSSIVQQSPGRLRSSRKL